MRAHAGRGIAAFAGAALLALLGACSSLPRINPDMARTAPAIQIEGARGPLSSARSKEILDGLRRGGRSTDVLERHLALEQALSDSPLLAVHAIGSSPDEPFSLIYATLISAIDSAEREVLLTNAYFVPDPQLLASLKAAGARGVDVQLLLPGSSDSALVFHAGRSYYGELLDAGIKLYERKNALLHAKTAVIDGVWSTVGSTNLDWRSFLHNHELNAVVLGAEFGERMRAAFEADRAQSSAVTPDEWRERTLDLRLKETLSRLWQYWL